MKKITLILLIILALWLTACDAATPVPTPDVGADGPLFPDLPVPKYTATGPMEETDASLPIEVNAGADFTITVETNPNTGLHWEVAVELNTAVVDYVWKDFFAKSEREGSPGWDVWTFKAVAPGETTITLAAYRGMTDVATVSRVFTIIVK
jgi:predicted secreted protein